MNCTACELLKQLEKHLKEKQRIIDSLEAEIRRRDNVLKVFFN